MKQDKSLPMPKVLLTGHRRPACFQFAMTEHPTRHRREAKWVAKVKGFPMATIALCPGCLRVARDKGKLSAYRAITEEERNAGVRVRHQAPRAHPVLARPGG